MTAVLVAWLATAIGLGFATLIVSGIKANNVVSFLIAATVLGLINAFIRPALWFLTAPLTVLTFGLFALAIIGVIGFISVPLLTGAEINWATYQYQSQTYNP